MSFGKYKWGELGKMSFGLLNTSLVVSKNGVFFALKIGQFLAVEWAGNVDLKRQ